MTKTLASIYFSALQEIRRPLYQGIFAVKVVKKGEPPFLLTIRDHQEINDMPYFAGVNNNKPYKQRVTILGEQIAEDVLAHWTKMHPEMTPQCAPGMWVVRDVVYLWDDDGKAMIDAEGRQEFRAATREERDTMFAEDLAAAMARQDAWVEAAIRKGDIMAEDPKKIPWIPQYCMDSVDYSGREREWRHGLREGDIKACPFCTKSIASRAFKCPHCGEVVDAVGYAEFKARSGEAQRRAEIKIAAELEADRVREEKQRLREEQAARKLALQEEGDRLIAAAQLPGAAAAAGRAGRLAEEAALVEAERKKADKADQALKELVSAAK